MAKAGSGCNKEKATNRIDVNNMLKKKVHKVQVGLELPNCLWNAAYAILHTGAGPNIFKMDGMVPSWKVASSVLSWRGCVLQQAHHFES